MSWKDWLKDEMIPQKQDELNQATMAVATYGSAITGITTSILHWQHWQAIYQGIQGECKSNLEAQLVVKAVYWEQGLCYPAWQPNHTYSYSNYVRPTIANGRKYYAVTPQEIIGYTTDEPPVPIYGYINGTSKPTEPTWPTGVGSTVVDNNITWYCQDISVTIEYGAGYGTINLIAWSIKDDEGTIVYQYNGIGWDSDVTITKAITDWNGMYALLNNSTNSPTVVLANLNGVLNGVANGDITQPGIIDWASSANTWKSQMTNRNSILDDYKGE